MKKKQLAETHLCKHCWIRMTHRPLFPMASLFGAAARFIFALLCLALAGLCLTTDALATQNLTLSNFVMDNQQGNVTLRFSLAIDDVESLRALLQDGSLLALKCRAKLARKRGHWLSKTLVDVEARHLLSGNSLTHEFLLEQDQVKTLRNKSLAALLAEGWNHMEINLGPFSLLERGQSYAVELEVSLLQADVPAWMRWALFFKSWEVAPAAGYRLDFEF